MSPRSRTARRRPEPLAIRWGRQGVRLSGGSLAFDTFGEAGATFVSHAGMRVPKTPGRLIMSDVTARLLGARSAHSLASPFRRRFSLGNLELELIPTAAIPGAAALVISRGRDSVIYAGRVGADSALGFGEHRVTRRCRQLVIAPDYDGPRDGFPPALDVFRELCELLRDALGVGEIPVLTGRALGRPLALVGPLAEQGFQVRAHRRIHRTLGLLRRAGCTVGRARRFAGDVRPGEVLLWPVDAPPPMPPGTSSLRRVLVSGRAVRPGAASEAGCDLGVPLADHADLPGLVGYIKACRPGIVSFTTEPAPSLASAVSELGLQQEVLGPVTQLSMFGEVPVNALDSQQS